MTNPTETTINDGRVTLIVTTFDHVPGNRVVGKRYRLNVYLDLAAAKFGSDAHAWERCELSAEELAEELASAKAFAARVNGAEVAA